MSSRHSFTRGLALLIPLVGIGCGSANGPRTDTEWAQLVPTTMHDAMKQDLTDLKTYGQQLCDAAPTTAWDAQSEPQAVADMRTAWVKARRAYERVEGATAPIFSDLDHTLDARYDDFMTDLDQQGGDQDLFDDQGVTGMHALERILYSDVTPQRIIAVEQNLHGYKAAAFPKTDAEATEFKTKLCARFVRDADQLLNSWVPAKIDVASAFQGLVSLMNEQAEKVNRAGGQEEESRYAQHTMVDIRDNLTGTRDIYGIFEPWITGKPQLKDADAQIKAGMARLEAVYDDVQGDAVPTPPDGWKTEGANTAENLATPFGKLYSAIREAVDPARKGSVVETMNQAATALGFPIFTAQ